MRTALLPALARQTVRLLHLPSVVLFASLSLPRLFGTAQAPEEIFIEGKLEFMMATPLEEYWSESNPKSDKLQAFSSGCWRGYIGTWKIEEEQLWLLKLERESWGKNDEIVRTPIPLRSVLKVDSDRPMPATWFSGVLRIARGERLAYVHMGFGSVYEEDEFIFIERGRVIGRRVVKNDASKITSTQDLTWRELGRLTESGGVKATSPDSTDGEQKDDWLTLGEVSKQWDELATSKREFRLRGIYFPSRLWIPPQQWMNDATFTLDTEGINTLPDAGGAVEVLGVMSRKDHQVVIRVRAIKALPLGAPIQRPLVPPGS